MAVVRGGDIQQLTINGREYEVKAEAAVNIDLGGLENDVSPAGNGEITATQKRKMGGFDGCTLLIDDTRKDLEALQTISNGLQTVPTVMRVASGVVYSGSLYIIGALKKNMADGTLDLEMRGKKFEQI